MLSQDLTPFSYYNHVFTYNILLSTFFSYRYGLECKIQDLITFLAITQKASYVAGFCLKTDNWCHLQKLLFAYYFNRHLILGTRYLINSVKFFFMARSFCILSNE